MASTVEPMRWCTVSPVSVALASLKLHSSSADCGQARLCPLLQLTKASALLPLCYRAAFDCELISPRLICCLPNALFAPSFLAIANLPQIKSTYLLTWTTDRSRILLTDTISFLTGNWVSNELVNHNFNRLVLLPIVVLHCFQFDCSIEWVPLICSLCCGWSVMIVFY